MSETQMPKTTLKGLLALVGAAVLALIAKFTGVDLSALTGGSADAGSTDVAEAPAELAAPPPTPRRPPGPSPAPRRSRRRPLQKSRPRTSPASPRARSRIATTRTRSGSCSARTAPT
ncbi:MAG: hypothetical protein AAFU73_18395 [Planctomycetota bacterium]